MSDPQTLPSQLLASLIEQVEQNSPVLILDAGFGVSDTVAFFNEFRCQLFFSAFYELLPLNQDRDDDADEEEAWFKIFQQNMNYPAGTRFDLCLFWDLFSYLNDAALRAFNRALAPFIDQRTAGHGFAMLNTAPHMPAREYGILNRNQLTIRSLNSLRAAPFPRSRTKVGEQLTSFTVGRGVLHQGGLMELMLKGKPSS
jgi:hypothetical protein